MTNSLTHYLSRILIEMRMIIKGSSMLSCRIKKTDKPN